MKLQYKNVLHPRNRKNDQNKMYFKKEIKTTTLVESNQRAEQFHTFQTKKKKTKKDEKKEKQMTKQKMNLKGKESF